MLAFTQLVDRNYGLVVSFSFALTGNPAQSDDLAQETFVNAWRRLCSLREPGRFRSWLLSIARNVSRKRHRKNRRSVIACELDPRLSQLPSGDSSPLERMIDQEEEALLSNALARIPKAYRIPLVLFYRDGQSVEEVAEALELSEESVRKRIFRGRRMLQELVTVAETILSRPPPRRPGLTAAIIGAISAEGVGGSRAPAAGPQGGAHRAILLAGAAVLSASLMAFLAPSRSPEGSPVRDRHAMRRPGPPPPPAFSPGILPGAASGLREAALPPGTRVPPAGTPILGFDFEDGLFPEIFKFGHVVPGPPRAGNQYSVMSTIHPGWGAPITVIGLETIAFFYRDTLVMSFDYWMGPDGGNKISLSIGHRGRCRYIRRLEGAVHSRWAHAVYRFSSLQAMDSCARKVIEPGDELESIHIDAAPVGGAPFFADNLRVVEYDADELRDVRDGLDQ